MRYSLRYHASTIAMAVALAASVAGGAVASAYAATPTSTPRNWAAAASTTRLFGVNVASTSQLPAMSSLSTSVHHPLGVIGFYADWVTTFPLDRLNAVALMGAEPMVTWEPWDHRLGGTQTTFPLRSIAAGAFDVYIRSWAAQAAAWNKPMRLRFAHEMNFGWYPWGLGVNGNTAGDYVAAFRHVHSLFVAVGASRVRWVWSPNVVTAPTSKLPALYPGSAYVDEIGMDGYNFGTGVSWGRWLDPATLLGPTLSQLPSFAPGKPVILAETASSDVGGDKAAWITSLLGYVAAKPEVKALLWSEFKGSANWPLESSSTSLAAMQAALATSAWR